MLDKSFKSRFYNLDAFSPRPELYFNGYRHYPNLCGSIVTLITTIIILFVGGYFCYTLFSNTISTQIIDKSMTSDFIINITDIPIILKVQDIYFNHINDSERFLKIVPVLVKQSYSYDANGNKVQSLVHDFLEIERCDRKKHFQSFTELLENITLEEYYCIKPTDFTEHSNLHGIYGAESFSILNFYFQLVNEGLDGRTRTNDKDISLGKNTTNTQANENVLKLAQNFRINLQFVENYADTRDAYLPLKQTIKNEMLLFTDVIFKRAWIYLTKLAFELDNGFLFSSIVTFNGFQAESVLETVDFDKMVNIPNTLSSISFLLNTKKTTYRVTYVKLPQILANIGGLSNGIIYCSQLLIWLFTLRMYNIDIINNILIKNSLKTKESKLNNVMTNINNYGPNNVTSHVNHLTKMNICTNMNNMKETKILGKEKKEERIPATICHYILPLSWNWSTAQEELYKRQLWLLRKYLDIQNILETNVMIFKQKVQGVSNLFMTTNNNNNISLISQDNMLK